MTLPSSTMHAVAGIAADENTVFLDPPQFPKAGLPQAGDGLFTNNDLAAIHRLLERLYAATLARNAESIRRTYVDVPVNLQPVTASIGLENVLDARPYGFTQIAVYGTTAANVALVRADHVEFDLVLTPGRWTTIQQPQGTRIALKAGDPTVLLTFRYSDQVWGTIQP